MLSEAILEPEIDKRTESAGVQCAEAEHEGAYADHEGHDVLPAVVFGEIDLVLHLEAELRQGEEREESCHNHGDVEVWVVAEVERRELEGEQTLDEHPRQIDALDAEEAAGQHDDEEGEEYTWNSP